MKEIRDIIKNIKENIDSYMDFDDDFADDFESYSFISKKDISIIKILYKIPDSKWSQDNYCRAYLILNSYRKELLKLGISFKDCEKPDIESYNLKKSSSKIDIRNKKIIFKENINNFESENIEKGKVIDLNLENIKFLYDLSKNKKIHLNDEALKEINIYLNNVDSEESIKIDNLESYNKQPMNFQKIAILYSLINKKAIIADEMGLGKSIIALSTIISSNSYPSIIICTKSLKHKWYNECTFIKDKKTEIISSKTDFNNLSKDIYILNYENISKYSENIIKNKFKSIVFDEGHYLKNPKSLRTKASALVSKNIDYVLSLTGSPVLNKASELISQIDILGKLDLFGGYNEFIDKYCSNERNDIRLKNKVKNIDFKDLSEKLRSYVYIRREKKDILKDLPSKQRTTILVDINKKAYNKELSEYKKETDLKKKKHILSKLKTISSNEKLNSIYERIDSFIESNEKVVVFAYHIDMQNKIIERYKNCLRITSNETEKERYLNQEKFQNDKEELLIVCSIKIAYVGFDFFASSQAIFAEMDWIPSVNFQAEDRLHRIGQLNPVNIWYIIAKDTIEEKIIDVNNQKIKITNEINKKIENLNIKDQVIKMLDDSF